MKTKILVIALAALCFGCATTYTKNVTVNKDANGNVTKTVTVIKDVHGTTTKTVTVTTKTVTVTRDTDGKVVSTR